MRLPQLVVLASVAFVVGCGGASARSDSGTGSGNNPDGGKGADAAPAAAGSLGGACNGTSDCTEGAEPKCAVPGSLGQTFAGGYCTSSCGPTLECPQGNTCVSGEFTNATGANMSVCLAGCDNSSNCRTGYACVTAQPANYCWPNCTGDGDCNVVGTSCDLNSGLCVVPPPDAGQVIDDDAGQMMMTTPDSGPPPPQDAGNFGPYPAMFPSPPQVPDQGGMVLAHPIIVPIFWTNDDGTTPAAVVEFLQKMTTSAYWAALSEYGVGTATISPLVTVSTSAAVKVTSGSISGAINSLVTAGTIPAPTSSTIYLMDYPSATSVSLDGSDMCSSGVEGYHSNAQKGSTSYTYAVMPRCSFPGETTLQALTGTLSHEIIEAASDPYPEGSTGAYLQANDAYLFLDYVYGGSEIGDMCEDDPQSDYTPPDIGYVVQRIWSNKRATMGQDPCGPELAGEVYFEAAPVLTSTVSYNDPGSGQTVTASCIPAGSLEVELYSEGQVSAPWQVQVMDINSYWQGGSPTVTATPSGPVTGNNGDHLTFTLSGTGGAGGDIFAVVSTNPSTMEQHFWIGMMCD